MAKQYVAIDLETTGLDRELDAIIEIGAVRFAESGEAVERFETLVNPGRPVGVEVLDLTGIREEELATAPPLFLVSAQIQAFLGDASLVGHNIAGFDVAFLDRVEIAHSPHLLDTQALASLLLPGLPEYNLGALAAHFGFGFTGHRAAADAEAARLLFLALRERALEFPSEVLAQVAQWLTPTSHPWRAFFADAWERAAARGTNGRLSLQAPLLPPPLHPAKQRPAPDQEQPVRVLASAHERPDVLPEFDRRPQQEEMTRAVSGALAAGGKLLVEAGTGTGKSLAYLIPSACHSLASGERVIVSTATINLQEQLTRKDIPALQALMPETALKACQLKGRRNYLCLRQFDALREGPLSDSDALLTSRVLLWLCSTETGDRAELRLTHEEEATWRTISAEASECTSETSPYVVDGTCFLQRARKQAEGSHIVVVNHALLLSDSATGGRVLPPYQHLVVDEAHHLEDEATRRFGFDANERRLAEMLEQCEDLPRRLQTALRGGTAAGLPYDTIAGAARGIRQSASAARTRLAEFSSACLGFLSDHSADSGEYDQRLHVNRGTRAQPDWPAVEVAWENLKLLLGELADGLDRLLSVLAGPDASGMLNQEILAAEVSTLLSEAQEVRSGIAAAIEQDDPQRVVWMERLRADGGLLVSWVPLTVNDLLQEQLFNELQTVVLTGATLRTRGDFRYIQERLGLDDAETLGLGSPFDYRRAALALLPRDMPEPSDPSFTATQARAIVDLVRASDGRALVLFTSHSSLRTVHSLIEGPLRGEGITALAQGVHGSPRQLVRSLLGNPRSVILGTSSFWEGVDIAGETLSLLIVARLPFNVPTEPVFAARSALYDDPFNQYGLPQAVLRFKQGFGRLIRRKTDRGVLAVLDGRVLKKMYGTAFVESLPGCTVRQALLREMPGLVRDWLACAAEEP